MAYDIIYPGNIVIEDHGKALLWAVNFYLLQGCAIMKQTTEVQTEGRNVFNYKMRKQRMDV